MKKPINGFAFGLGILSIAYGFTVVPDIVEIVRQPSALVTMHDANYVKSFAARDILVALRSTIYGSGVLMAFAVIVEILDRIRLSLSADRTRT
jgi:hypothetical protein